LPADSSHREAVVWLPHRLYYHHMVSKLLLVDDGPLDVVLTQQALSHCDIKHEITVARDAEEAIEQLGQSQFDIILLDIQMPKVDGFDLLKRLRATPSISHIPVILVTSSDLEADRLRAATLGVVGYVNKSMNNKVFQSHLHAALRPYGLC
jgi:CheY-like chemotaxis protein